MITRVEFKATDGTILRGGVYRPEGLNGPTPIIIVTGGFSATIMLRTFAYAEYFAKAGLAVLAYDHRNFGESDGAIRQEIDPQQQLADMRDAVTYARTLPGIDPERIGVWGSSYSGGHAIVMGATDARIKCVVAQVPFISGLTGRVRSELSDRMNALFAKDRKDRANGAAPMMLPVVTEDPTAPAALPSRDAWVFTKRVMSEAPNWKNEVTLRSLELAGGYDPGAYISFISPKPLLLVVGSRDTVCAAEVTLNAYERALEPKKLVLLDAAHFDPYDVCFEESAGAAADWFNLHLKG